MSKHTTVEVWADVDIVAMADTAENGQRRINLFFSDFFDNGKTSAMIHLGPKQALEVIEELQQALVDLLVP